MSLTKSLISIGILGIIGAILFFSLFPIYSPKASADLQFTRSEIIEKARDFLSDMGYETEALDADANFNFRQGLALFMQDTLGLAKAHNIIRADTLDIHRWHIYFYDRLVSRSQMPDRYDVWVSPSGHIRGFEHHMKDTTSAPSLEESAARSLTEKFLTERGVDLTNFSLDQSSHNQLPNRKDYYFKWVENDSVYGMTSELWAKVKGERIGGFGFDLDEPEAFVKAGSNIGTVVTFIITGSSIATFFLLIFVITLFLKKYHEGEVGIKTALVIFAVLFGIIFFEQVLAFTTIGYGSRSGDLNRFNMRLVVFFIQVFIILAFIAAMAFAGWSVGESSARRGWGNKLTAIDGLLQRKPFSLHFGAATVRGYAFGFILLALIFGIVAIVSRQTHFAVFTLGLSGIPESRFPALSAMLLGLRIAILNEIIFRFFFISWLREKTKKVWPGLLVSSLLWTLVAFNLWNFPMGFLDFRLLFPTFFLMSLIFGLILIKYDLLTSIITNWVTLSFVYAIPMLVSSSDYFGMQSNLFYGFMALPLALGFIGFIKKQKVTFSRELAPAHIRRITERERMEKELEIARNVQMSLLPKENPLLEGFDIAGVCIPALEVGGDYYDFFQLGDGKIGIAIGDVSGKGVPAAIYMTLTKGILQSHASESLSPKEVLYKLNRQMYQNIERNSFVSMFYAILDMKNNKIRFSRAGHNPAILAHRGAVDNTFLEPKGIALGLESGDRFADFLEEHEIALQSGDVLTFYTDGFTEAATEAGEEFGEEKLERVISEYKDTSSNMIIQHVVRSVKKFVGNYPQHDDMTMVVLKVL